jgi:hypothetical protein
MIKNKVENIVNKIRDLTMIVNILGMISICILIVLDVSWSLQIIKFISKIMIASGCAFFIDGLFWFCIIQPYLNKRRKIK